MSVPRVVPLSREPGTLLARLKPRRCREVGHAPTVPGRVWIHGPGQVVPGRRVVLDGRLAPLELHAMKQGRIAQVDGVTVEGGASLEAAECITVGTRPGASCKVMDPQHHPLRGNRHEAPPSVGLVIEAEGTVGGSANLLPGARLGAGCTVAPGTVVFPAHPCGGDGGRLAGPGPSPRGARLHLRLPFARLPAALEQLPPWLASLEPRAERATGNPARGMRLDLVAREPGH